jgi:uncharacterized peroxidase-related enzyme
MPGSICHDLLHDKNLSAMAHINLPEGAPGIRGPMIQYPETEKPLNALAEALLRGPSSLTPGERETIAAFVSARNECYFCHNTHAATAAYLLGGNRELVNQVSQDYTVAPVSAKMKELLKIAGKVQQDGRLVTEEDVAAARHEGADDKAIHDTVLIAAGSACLTVMWTAWLPSRRVILPFTRKSVHGWLREGTSTASRAE